MGTGRRSILDTALLVGLSTLVAVLLLRSSDLADAEKESSELVNQLVERTGSMSMSWGYSGRRFPRVWVADEERVGARGRELILLFGSGGCLSCLEREVAFLDSLSQVAPKGVSFAGLYYNDELSNSERPRILPSFPVYDTQDSRLHWFVGSVELPLLFYVVDGTIVSSFKPLDDDESLSRAFYATLAATWGSELPAFSDSDLVGVESSVFVDPLSWSVQAMPPSEAPPVRGKPIVVNFWATWCGACIEELPEFEILYEDLAGEVDFFFITTESEETVGRFLRRNPYRLPWYTVNERDLPTAVRPEVWPTTLLVNSGNQLVARHVGAARWNDPRVKSLLLGLE
ncbi:MAG: TlpA family protein disulfide reductase [Rhodothermales bacterium]|nr:TlpA family protein disulfide reductase [Rhodothermales bacterium]